MSWQEHLYENEKAEFLEAKAARKRAREQFNRVRLKLKSRADGRAAREREHAAQEAAKTTVAASDVAE